MDRLTILMLAGACACALTLALWGMHMAHDAKVRLDALEHLVYGTETSV